jgi:tellurite resistance protein TerC
MNSQQITYLVFGLVLALALVFDLGLLSKKNQAITIKQALNQTLNGWCTTSSIFYSIFMNKKGIPKDVIDASVK